MSELVKILLIIGGFILAAGGLALAILRALGKKTEALVFDDKRDQTREKEAERISTEIKLESDQALAERFNKLAKKKGDET